MGETLDEFLARGGKINTLPMGYTAFPDGNIPVRPKPRKADIIETPSAAIESRNENIRKAVKPKREPKPKASLDQIRDLVKEQTQVLSEVYSKFFHGDKKRFCKLCGIGSKTLDNAKTGNGRIGQKRWDDVKLVIASFEYSKPRPKQKRYKPVESEEKSRRRKITAAKKEAEKNGQSVFMAPCKHHGMTKYYLHGKQSPRCAACRLAITKNQRELHKDAEQKCKDQRAALNKERLLEAVEKGEAVFTGLCVSCGYTDFKYSRSPNTIIGCTYRCITCTRASQIKYKAKKKGAIA